MNFQIGDLVQFQQTPKVFGIVISIENKNLITVKWFLENIMDAAYPPNSLIFVSDIFREEFIQWLILTFLLKE